MFDQLKPLMQNGERYVVVEGGKPEYVLMRFRDYAALAGGRTAPNPPHRPAAEWERANVDLEEVRSGEPAAATGFGAEPSALDPSTIRLEDLPL